MCARRFSPRVSSLSAGQWHPDNVAVCHLAGRVPPRLTPLLHPLEVTLAQHVVDGSVVEVSESWEKGAGKGARPASIERSARGASMRLGKLMVRGSETMARG